MFFKYSFSLPECQVNVQLIMPNTSDERNAAVSGRKVDAAEYHPRSVMATFAEKSIQAQTERKRSWRQTQEK